MNEETGNRRPVMLSVLTRCEKEAQATAAKDQSAVGATASDTEAEAKLCVKGNLTADCSRLIAEPLHLFQAVIHCRCQFDSGRFASASSPLDSARWC